MMNRTAKKESKALAEHFFRQEYSKMVSVITRYFGLSRINMAEDVVQDTLLEAIKSWEFNGIPENPSAWLYTVAKNKALNTLKRIKLSEEYQNQNTTGTGFEEIDFSEEQIADDQLRMMFACCHPSISQNAQVALILKTLCGLSINEIARAFLTSPDTINKRLVRARKTLKDENISFELPYSETLDERLAAVLKTIFLLFNEGYSTSKGNTLINYDICIESIRLAELICSHGKFQSYSSPNALLSLMLLNASRFSARTDENGQMIRMVHQDRSLWNQQLITRGLRHLKQIENDTEVSIYHIMATISAYHCIAKRYEDTNWEGILSMYETLVLIDDSPLVLLNRAIALTEVKGTKAGIASLLEIEKKIPKGYYLFHSTLADFYMKEQDFELALDQLNMALDLVQIEPELEVLKMRIASCEERIK